MAAHRRPVDEGSLLVSEATAGPPNSRSLPPSRPSTSSGVRPISGSLCDRTFASPTLLMEGSRFLAGLIMFAISPAAGRAAIFLRGMAAALVIGTCLLFGNGSVTSPNNGSPRAWRRSWSATCRLHRAARLVHRLCAPAPAACVARARRRLCRRRNSGWPGLITARAGGSRTSIPGDVDFGFGSLLWSIGSLYSRAGA